VMPRYRSEQRKSRAGATPLNEQRIDVSLQRAAENCVAGIVMEAGRRLYEWAERRGPQFGNLCLKGAGEFADIMERHQSRQRFGRHIDRGPKGCQQHRRRGRHVEAVMRHTVHRRGLAFSPGLCPELE
jgi:hypothetical protein